MREIRNKTSYSMVVAANGDSSVEPLEAFLRHLDEVQEAENRSENVNFIQAAFVLQKSTIMYCKKVDGLHQDCFDALDIFSLSHKKKNASKGGRKKNQDAENILHDEFVQLLDDDIPAGKDLTTSIVHQPIIKNTPAHLPLALAPREESEKKFNSSLSQAEPHASGFFLLDLFDAIRFSKLFLELLLGNQAKPIMDYMTTQARTSKHYRRVSAMRHGAHSVARMERMTLLNGSYPNTAMAMRAIASEQPHTMGDPIPPPLSTINSLIDGGEIPMFSVNESGGDGYFDLPLLEDEDIEKDTGRMSISIGASHASKGDTGNGAIVKPSANKALTKKNSSESKSEIYEYENPHSVVGKDKPPQYSLINKLTTNTPSYLSDSADKIPYYVLRAMEATTMELALLNICERHVDEKKNSLFSTDGSNKYMWGLQGIKRRNPALNHDIGVEWIDLDDVPLLSKKSQTGNTRKRIRSDALLSAMIDKQEDDDNVNAIGPMDIISSDNSAFDFSMLPLMEDNASSEKPLYPYLPNDMDDELTRILLASQAALQARAHRHDKNDVSFDSNSEGNSKNTIYESKIIDLNKRVVEWTNQLEGILEKSLLRNEFDETKGKKKIIEKTKEFIVGQSEISSCPFSRLTEDLQPWQATRTFLLTLMLANEGAIEICGGNVTDHHEKRVKQVEGEYYIIPK